MGEYRKERKRAKRSEVPSATRASEAKIEAAKTTVSSRLRTLRRAPPDPKLQSLLREIQLGGLSSLQISSNDLSELAKPERIDDSARQQASVDSIAVQSVFDARLVQLLKNQPELTRQLPGDVFEQLVAEILAFLGFQELSLRVQTELGEIDILGCTKDHFGTRVAYLFELKQFGVSGRPVELREITRLFGLREGLRHRLGLTQGVFVTTTSYTTAAKEAAELHRLNLKAHADLVDWLSQYRVSPGGLYLRNQ
jgi:hypothetical protein